MLKFRNLRPDEIEVRPTDTNKKGKATLLLYKDARTDRRILSEAVGAENWQREFYAVNGATFCKVGIWDDKKEQWIWKSDCGSENTFEREKSLASDSFKRACFAWGIGVELYNTPKIKIDCPDKYYYNDKFAMTFYVSRFIANGENIEDLEICDRFGKVVYSLTSTGTATVRYTETKSEDRKIKAGGSPEEYREPEEEKDEWLDKLADFYREKKEEDFYAAWSFYRYWKGLIEDGRFPKSLKALWNKWIDSPNRDKDEEEYRKWKKSKDEAKALSDND